MFRRRALLQVASAVRRSWVVQRQVEGCAAQRCTQVESPISRLAGQQVQYRRYRRDWRGYERFDRSASASHAEYVARQRQRLVFVAVGGGSIGAVLWYTHRQEVPYTHRMRAVFCSVDMERALGEATFEQVKHQAQADGTVLPGWSKPVQAVTRVGKRIAEVASDGYGGGFCAHMQGLEWEFVVINSPQVNAFVVPGGKVVVFTGLLKLLKTEDELAAVLAHEVAHVVARHSAEQLSKGQVMELFRMAMYWIFGIPIPSAAMTLAFFLPHSRRAETEADMIGLCLAARACFDPAASATVFSILGHEEQQHGAAGVPRFLRTHPLSEERTERVKHELPAAMQLYEQSACDAAKTFLGRSYVYPGPKAFVNPQDIVTD